MTRLGDLPYAQRFDALADRVGALAPEIIAEFKKTSLDQQLADSMVENRVSGFELPVGIAFISVDGTEHAVPMATEEASVIAACNAGAKMIGDMSADVSGRVMRGQIAFSNVADARDVMDVVAAKRPEIFDVAKSSYPHIVARGGGLRDVICRDLGEGYVSVDFLIDTCDAMGANIIDSILEGVAARLGEWLPGQSVLMSILSNYTTECVTRVEGRLPLTRLGGPDHGRERGLRMAAACEFAGLDVYRATTHNKGILNGIEAVALATGNDTRAIAAACHAYAARSGTYGPLSSWRIDGTQLVGTLEVPLAIATRGGATRLLPKASAGLELIATRDARELSAVTAAVGLAQNFAALRALTNEGIQRGHMAMRARAVSVAQPSQ